MACEYFEYMGHEIRISLSEVSDGLYTWDYLIDFVAAASNPMEHSKSESFMLRQALEHAQRSIDSIPDTSPPGNDAPPP